MSDTRQWNVRRKGTKPIATTTGARLAEYIGKGVIGAAHDVRPVGSKAWMSVEQALPFLPQPSPSLANAPDTESSVELEQMLDFPKPIVPPPPPPPLVSRQSSASIQTPVSREQRSNTIVPPPNADADRSGRWKVESPTPAPPATVHDPGRSPAIPAAQRSDHQSVHEAPDPTPDLPTLPDRRPNRRNSLGGEEDELDMTPMIDMTFLLLIFFMVTSTISPYAELQLPEAQAGDAERPEGRVVLVLDYPEGTNIDDSGRYGGSEFIELADCKLYLADEGDSPIPPDQLHAALVDAFDDNGGGEFILQSNRKMPVGVVRQIIKTAKAAGAGDTMIGVARPR